VREHNDSPRATAPRRPATKAGWALFAVPFLVLLSPILLAYSVWDDYRSRALRRQFLRRWPGKRGLLVYSSSPNWQTYVEKHWLPTLGEQVVILNWSERATWAQRYPFEQRVFRRYGGEREFNPLAIIFKPRQRFATLRAWLHGIRRLDPLGMFAPNSRDTAVVRFFQAFREYKHGKDRLLRTKEMEMFEALRQAKSAPDA
jgi:hypothetical protein